MSRAPQTVRSARTRAALRRAAMTRFLEQGVEATTAEQIAQDAGVTLRTFYRHFETKHDLLFADYDSGLQWLRDELRSRPADEPLLVSVGAAIFSFPYDPEAVSALATLRAEELDPDRLARHLRGVQADFADAVAEHLRRRGEPDLDAVITASAIGGAVFGVMGHWMRQDDRSLQQLAALTREALGALQRGADESGMFRQS